MPDGMPAPMYLAFLRHQDMEIREANRQARKRAGKKR